MAATLVNNIPHFIGGSSTTYNYNGIAYNKSGGISPHKIDFYYRKGTFQKTFNSQLPMDLRELASVNDSIKYIYGGMGNNQRVSNKILKLHWF